jgi:hypothetical protein
MLAGQAVVPIVLTAETVYIPVSVIMPKLSSPPVPVTVITGAPSRCRYSRPLIQNPKE